MSDAISRDAAMKALDWGDIYGRNAEQAIAALPSVTPRVKVKPLVWKAHYAKYDGGKTHYGTGVFEHWYCVGREKTGVWLVVHHVGSKPCHLAPAETLEAAKAAAQADYEARIMAALDLTTQAAPDVAGAAKVLLTALERAQIDMEILRMFFNGQPRSAFEALAEMEGKS